MPLTPEDNPDDGDIINLPPDQYSVGDQKNDVIPYPQPLAPSSGSRSSGPALPPPTITSLGGVYTPRPNTGETEDDIPDAEWRYVDPDGRRTAAPPPPTGDRSARRPFWVPNPDRAAAPDARVVTPRAEAASIREGKKASATNRLVRTLLIGALAFGGGAMATKAIQSSINSRAGIERGLGAAAAFDGTNLNALLGRGENARLDYLSVNPDWYSTLASATDANGQLDTDRYKIVTVDGREFPTGEGIVVGARTFYEFMGPDSRDWYMIKSSSGISFAIAR